MRFIQGRIAAIKKALSRVADKLRQLENIHGREAQRKRRLLRHEQSRLLNEGVREVKATKRGDSKGAFGCCRAVLCGNAPWSAAQQQRVAVKRGHVRSKTQKNRDRRRRASCLLKT